MGCVSDVGDHVHILAGWVSELRGYVLASDIRDYVSVSIGWVSDERGDVSVSSGLVRGVRYYDHVCI